MRISTPPLRLPPLSRSPTPRLPLPNTLVTITVTRARLSTLVTPRRRKKRTMARRSTRRV